MIYIKKGEDGTFIIEDWSDGTRITYYSARDITELHQKIDTILSKDTSIER